MGKNKVVKGVVKVFRGSKSKTPLSNFPPSSHTDKVPEAADDLRLQDKALTKLDARLTRRNSMSNLHSAPNSQDKKFNQSKNEMDDLFAKDSLYHQDLMGSPFPKDMESPPSKPGSAKRGSDIPSYIYTAATINSSPTFSDNSKGVERIEYSTGILNNINALQEQIATSQKDIEEIITNYELRNADEKNLKEALSGVSYDTNAVKQVLELSELKQSLATNQIMLVFQQQAELLQEQVNPRSPAYVKYNSEEKALIAQIDQQARELYAKGTKLDAQILSGTNQKRADKLVNNELLDTKFSGLTNKVRPRDAGLKLDEVNPHYSLDDLKVILKQFQKANKEMGALLKMPDVSKRCGLLASLYDCTTALATKAAFLIPQTAVAAVSIVEYGISTVLVDTVKQGWTSAKNAGSAVWEKRGEFIKKTILERNAAIVQSISNNREAVRNLKEALTNKVKTLDIKVQQINEEGIKNTLLEFISERGTKKLHEFAEQYQIKEIKSEIRQLQNLEKQFKKLDAQVNKAASAPLTKLATAILGVPVAVILGGFSGVAKTVTAGAKNATVNMPDGIRDNYKKYAKTEVEVEGKGKIKQDRSWNKSFSEIYTPNQDARDAAHKERAEAAAAKKALPNEIKQQKTRSSELKLPEAEPVAFVRQNRQTKLQEYIEKTKASIDQKDEELKNRIGGVKNLIQSATPESYIKNTVLAEDEELLKDVVELTKLKQQNAVSNIMLPFLMQAESLEQQDYADKSKEQKVHEEIQDLAISLAEKASVLNEKIEKEISHKRADKLEKNTLKKDLSDSFTDISSPEMILNAVMGGDYDLNDLKSIKKVFEKANKEMDALIKMPDVSQRCGLLASLYDLTTALAKSSAFLIPQTAVAAASIVQYAIMTVVVDTVEQGWTSAKKAGKDVWEKRGEFIKKTIKERADTISDWKKINEANIELAESQLSRKPTADTRYEVADLQHQQRALEKELAKAQKAPVISFATAILGVPVAVIWGGFSGVGKTIVAGAKNITFNASGDKQLGERWAKHTTDEQGNKKSWTRTPGKVHSDDRTARGARHEEKANRGLAARELQRRADAKNKGTSHTV